MGLCLKLATSKETNNIKNILIHYLLLKPLHCLILVNAMLAANATALPLTFRYVKSRTSQNDVEIHAINSNAGVIFNSKINVFLDAKAKISILGKVVP